MLAKEGKVIIKVLKIILKLSAFVKIRKSLPNLKTLSIEV